MGNGQSIELYLVNGTADSLVTAELSNWNGKAIKIPRIEVSECNREDVKDAGVYFLFCKDDDGDFDSVYIGEAENIQERLIQHLRDYSSEKEEYYWNTAVLFTGSDLNKAFIRYLENRLVKIATESKRYRVLTKKTYSNTVLKESSVDAMETFIVNLKVLINVLGYKVLEPMIQKDCASGQKEQLLYLNIGNTKATGMVTAEGFVLISGSSVNEKTNEKSLGPCKVKRRNSILNSDKVKDGKTVEDILFGSSSAAADFVLGYNVSGPGTWKDKYGRTLHDIDANKFTM